jgi:RecG-like helicase
MTINARLRAGVPPHPGTAEEVDPIDKELEPRDEGLDPIEHSPTTVQSEWLRHLSETQAKIAQEIIRAVRQRQPGLMLLKGSAGTGKTHTVKIILEILRERNIPYLISATTGIAAVQYSGGQTVHSLFSLGIDEVQTSFHINIGSDSTKGKYIQNA